MKWWKKLLVLLVAGVVCGAIMRVMALWVSKNTLSASAAEQTYGDLTYVLHNGNAEITGCAAGVTALEIPAEIGGRGQCLSQAAEVADRFSAGQRSEHRLTGIFRLYQLAGDHSSVRHTVCQQLRFFRLHQSGKGSAGGQCGNIGEQRVLRL